MKKVFAVLMIAFAMTSCVDSSRIDDTITVEQINILEGGSHKYEVKLKTRNRDSYPAYLYTNYRFQVGDTMAVLSEYLGKKDEQIRRLKFELDSIKKEHEKTKYYLELLNDKVIFSEKK